MANEPLDRAGILTILTTEHYTLQGARGTALSDMQGRGSLFMTAVSGALVAVGFIGGQTHMGREFTIATLLLVGTLWVLGTLTFVRMVQIAVEDVILAFGIARIRHRYTELAPDLAPLFVRSRNDDFPGMEREMGVRGGWFQLLMPTSTVVAVVTAVLAGVEAAFVATLRHADIATASGIGVVAAVLAVVLLERLSARMWANVITAFPPQHPSPPQSTAGHS